MAAFAFTGCASSAGVDINIQGGSSEGTQEEPANFLMGVWHGFISPVTLVISIFNEDRTVYEDNNSGGWYTAGFVIGLLIMLSALGITRVRRPKNR